MATRRPTTPCAPPPCESLEKGTGHRIFRYSRFDLGVHFFTPLVLGCLSGTSVQEIALVFAEEEDCFCVYTRSKTLYEVRGETNPSRTHQGWGASPTLNLIKQWSARSREPGFCDQDLCRMQLKGVDLFLTPWMSGMNLGGAAEKPFFLLLAGEWDLRQQRNSGG